MSDSPNTDPCGSVTHPDLFLSILYVDDEEDLLTLGKVFLERLGTMTVDVASSAPDALASPRLHTYDAIVSDYQMPVMDGIDFLKAIRRDHGTIPFILFTGRGREEVVIEAINNGADFYVQKGGDPRAQFTELHHKIRQAVIRQRAEHSLIESEKRLTDIINFLPDATFVIDRDGIVIAWNRAIEEMTGIAAEEILGKGDYEYALPFYGERRKILIDLVFEPDEVVARGYTHIQRNRDLLIAEATLRRPDGEPITMMVTASPLYNNNGEVVGAIESIRDITERKKIEDDLRDAYEVIAASEEELRSQLSDIAESEDRIRKSEENYRNLFENSVVGIFRSTLEGKITAINTSFARIAGYSSPDEMMTTVADIRTQLYVRAEDRDLVTKALLKDGIVKGYIAQLYHRDGYPLWARINARAVRDHDGKTQYFEGTVEDITEQKKTEDALIKEQLFSDAVIDSIPGLLYLYNADGNLVRWNKNHEILTGYSPSELIEKNILDFFDHDPNAAAQVSVVIARATRDGQATVEVPLERKDHTLIPFFLTFKRLEIERKTYLTGVGIDISERKKNEEALHDAYTQLSLREEELQKHLRLLSESEQKIRESEIKFRLVFEKSLDALMLTENGRLIECNNTALRLFGYNSLDEMAGMLPSDASPETQPDGRDSLQAAREHVDAAFQNGEDRFEWVHRRKDESTFPAEVVLSSFENNGRKYLQSSIRDITERKQSEEALRASEERYRHIVEYSPFGMHFYELNPTGDLVFTGGNKAADQILGVDHSHLIGKTINEAFPALSGTVIPEQYRRIATEGGVWHTDQITYHHGEIQGAYAVQVFQIQPGRIVATFRDITERKRAEEALQRSEKRLREAQEMARLGFWSWDVKTGAVEWSDEVYNIMGLDPETFTPHIDSILALSPWPEENQRGTELIRRAMESHAKGEYEQRFLRPDATIGYYHSTFEGRYDEDGTLITIFGTVHDITRRKQAEMALRKSEEEFRQFITLAPLPLCLVDEEDRIEYGNDRFYQVFGFTPEEIPTLTDWWRLAYPDPGYRERVMQTWTDLIHKAAETQSDIEPVEFLVTCKDGTVRSVIISGITIGKKYLAMFQDNTEQRKAEKALRESEERYRNIIMNIQDVFFQIDRENRIVMASESAARVFGYGSVSEMVGMPVLSVWKRPDERKEFIEALKRGGGAVYGYEAEFVKKDKSPFWVSMSGRLITDEKGEYAGTEGILHDITTRKRAEEAVLLSNRKLNLLSGITRHDINNQLTILTGLLDLSEEALADPEENAKYIQDEKRVVNTISRQILFTKDYEDMGVQAPVWQSVQGIIESVLSRLPAEDIRIDLPASPLELYADPLLGKVFYNLIDNALRYGGEKMTMISLTTRKEEGDLVVIIEDDGAGIRPEDKSNLFTKGFGVNTGLGLFLSREILSITGMTITETGTSGSGARFEIRVPEGQYRSPPGS